MKQTAEITARKIKQNAIYSSVLLAGWFHFWKI